MHDLEIECKFGSRCSGCSCLSIPYQDQIERKRLEVLHRFTAECPETHLPTLEVKTIAPAGLRDRADLIIECSDDVFRCGLYDKDHSHIVDIDTCPQLSPQLNSWLTEFRKIRIPIKRGSVRLRVSPSGQRGVWLDFSNLDVKFLLEEKETLNSLMSLAFVEVGQRRKRLTVKEGHLKLTDPEVHPWFETYLNSQLTPAPLYCNVGSFTQPGFRANKVLIEIIHSFLSEIKSQRVAEFGSGIGNFTLPLAAATNHVDAYEIDQLACQALQHSLEAIGLTQKVTILQGDFQRGQKHKTVQLSQIDTLFVDPPRSGLMNFLEPLAELSLANRPRHFIYISCFLDSFMKDALRLNSLGYSCQRIVIVDQFPQTAHFEIISLWKIL